MRRFVTPLILGLLLVTPATAEQDSFESFRKNFIGTWQITTGPRITTATWRADGTWASETIDSGKLVLKLSGVWWTHDQKLHGVCITANDPNVPRGVDDASEVVEVTDDYYTIKNWRGVLKKYTRVKDKG